MTRENLRNRKSNDKTYEQAELIRESLKKHPKDLEVIVYQYVEALNLKQSFDYNSILNYKNNILTIYAECVQNIGNLIPSERYKQFFHEIAVILGDAKKIPKKFEPLDSNVTPAIDDERAKTIELYKKANSFEERVVTTPDIPLITAEELAKRLREKIISYEEKRAELEADIAKLASELGEIIPDFVLRENPEDNIDIIEELKLRLASEFIHLNQLIKEYKPCNGTRSKDFFQNINDFLEGKDTEETVKIANKITAYSKIVKQVNPEIEDIIYIAYQMFVDVLNNINSFLENEKKITQQTISIAIAYSKTVKQITQEEDHIINSTHELFFRCFNSTSRADFLKKISDTHYFRGYLDLKYEGKNILDIAIEQKDIESINILINKIKQKCPDFFKQTNVGKTLIKKLNVLVLNLDYNGSQKIQLLQEEIGRAMTLPRAYEASERVPRIGNISSIAHQYSEYETCPSHMMPTKSSCNKAVENLTTPQPATKKVNSPSTFNTPIKICKSFVSLLLKKPQIPGYQGSTISSYLRTPSKAGFDSSTHKTTPEENTLPLEFDPKDLIEEDSAGSGRVKKGSTDSKLFSEELFRNINPVKLTFSGKASGEHPRKLDKKYLEEKRDNFRHLIESSSSEYEEPEGRLRFSR